MIFQIAGAVIIGLGLGMCVGIGLSRKQDEEADQFVSDLVQECPPPPVPEIDGTDISTEVPEHSGRYPWEKSEKPFEVVMAETESPEDDEGEEAEEDAEDIVEEQRYSLKHSGEPYIIDESFYFAHDAGYGQQTLTYSESEMLLRDENEEVIMDVARYVGYDALERFGEGSSDPNTVYVRNDRMRIDYEVVREE